jgi:hypothetical protein
MIYLYRPVDGHVPCDRPNRAPEFEGPPIFCSPVEYRRMAQAQQAKLWLIGRAPSRNRKLFVPRSLTGCSFTSLSPCPETRSIGSFPAPRTLASSPPSRDRHPCSLVARRRPSAQVVRSPPARRPGSDSDENSAPIFRLRRKFLPAA